MIRLSEDTRRKHAEIKAAERALLAPSKKTAKAEAKKAKKERADRIGQTAPGQRKDRERDPGFLNYLRGLPCEARHTGGCGGRVEAAHIRYSDFAAGSVNPGKSRKNHDRFCNPLCREHHQGTGGQHHRGDERAWWASIGKDAYATAADHYARYQAASGQTPLASAPPDGGKT